MKPGETRSEPCSWRCGAIITVTCRRYPPSTGISGLFWDQGDHECGVVRRAKFPFDAAPSGIDLGVAKISLPPGRDE